MTQTAIRYVSVLALWLALGWFFTTLSAEPSFYYSLVSKVGVLHSQDGHIVQYANVEYCGKVVSVTAEHVVKVIPKFAPNGKLITSDKEFDLAIYERLGPEEASPLAIKLPLPFEVTYIPTYFWVNLTPVVYQSLVIGFMENRILVQNMGFFGMSGSGTYNAKGEYIGPAIRMFTAPGFNIPELPEASTEQQAGIIGIGRTDKLVEMFKAKVCGVP